MRTIYRIAKLELSTLFYSPVAWLVLIIFMIQSGWNYMYILERLERAQQLGIGGDDLTARIFAGFVGVYTKMQENLYLYIPLLTMGLISREISSGSIKLLFSSPIKVHEIVLGKFMAMVAYCFLLMTILLLLCAISLFTIGSADAGFMISGLVGLYLQICAYSAIGLFMSCLTSYQVVAAISTLVVLAALNFVGGLWQGIDFVRDITYFLSISGRSDKIIEGLITSKDVLYFVIVIVLFLGLTVLKLQSARESKPAAVKAIRYVLFVCTILLAGYISSRPALTLYADMTRNKNRTLTENSQGVIKSLTHPLKITTYVNLLDENYYRGLPEYRNSDLELFSKYIRFKPDIEMKYVYFYDSTANEELYSSNKGIGTLALAKKVADSRKLDIRMFMTPAEIAAVIDLKPEGNRFVRQLEYNGKKTFLRMYNDLYRNPSEKEITAAMKRLIATPPKIAFIKGHNERSIDRMGDQDYKVSTVEQTFRYALVNQGFDIMEIDLSTRNIPAGIAALVIADPKSSLQDAEVKKIMTYIAAGGNMLIAGEPGRTHFLSPVTDGLGIQFKAGTLVQQSRDFSPDLLQTGIAKGAEDIMVLRRKDAVVSFPGAAALQYRDTNNFRIKPLIITDPANTWNKIAAIDIASQEVSFDEKAGDERSRFPVALALTRTLDNREQRIMVIGDADFMSNSELGRRNISSSNFAFTTELFKWFSFGAFPIDTTLPEPEDKTILVSHDEISWLRIAFIGILPALIAGGVIWLLLRRKRR